MAEKTRYSDEELEEFKAIIKDKLAVARNDYGKMMKQLMNADGNDVDDTSPTYKVLEEGSATQSKEELMQQAARLQKFIQGLEGLSSELKTKPMASTASQANLYPRNVCVRCLMLHSVWHRRMP